jgi:non-canonical purine NTP pyrophosphatase (RdgB/HAM1 family)
VETVLLRPYRPTDEAAVLALWQACGLTRPWNDPQRDIARKLTMQAEGFIVALDGGQQIVGTVMAGYDGHRGWINYLAVSAEHRRHGLGRRLMDAAERFVRALGAPKLNLQLRSGNDGAAHFYERLGYVRDELLSYGKRLVEDAPRPAPAPIGGTLVLASRNAKKLKEMQALFAPLGTTLRPVSEFSDVEPDETAASFIENALIKARHAAQVSGLPALADDSGLEVAALNGAPGVRSARYAGEPASDAANNAKLLDALRDVPQAQRGARFVSVLAWLRHADDPVPLIAQGFWNGRILDVPQGDEGFGYDPLFFVPDCGCSAAQLAPEVKNRISHRARAGAELLRQLQAL